MKKLLAVLLCVILLGVAFLFSEKIQNGKEQPQFKNGEMIPFGVQYDHTAWMNYEGMLECVDNQGTICYFMGFDYQDFPVEKVQIDFTGTSLHTVYFFDNNLFIIQEKEVEEQNYIVEIDETMAGLAFEISEEEAEGTSVLAYTSEDYESNRNYPTVSILGDSVSACQWTIPRDYLAVFPAEDIGFNEMWWNIAADSLKLRILVNNSCSGSGVTNLISDYEQFAASEGRGKELSLLGENPDQIWILIGGNDVLFGIDYGEVDKAYRKLLEDIKAAYPSSKVTLFSYYTCLLELDQRIDWIQEEMKQLADLYNCDFIDLQECGITKENQKEVSLDFYAEYGLGFHPNKEGMKLIGSYVAQEKK